MVATDWLVNEEVHQPAKKMVSVGWLCCVCGLQQKKNALKIVVMSNQNETKMWSLANWKSSHRNYASVMSQ